MRGVGLASSRNRGSPAPAGSRNPVSILRGLAGMLLVFGLVAIPWNFPRPDARFGIVEAYNAPGAAWAAGAAWERARFHWGALQPDGPVSQWKPVELNDGRLSRELAEGREVVGLLIGVPPWARDLAGMPAGLDRPVEDPENLWAGFVRRVVGRYRGRIQHWIIWNEPDVWQPDHPAFSWPGTVDDFVQLMKVSYLAAHEANPDAVVHLAAVSHYWDANFGRELYFERFLDAVAQPEWGGAAHNYFFDAATLHLYFNPEANYDVLVRYTAMLRERGLSQPVWLVETNAPPADDPTWPVPGALIHVSQQEQAAYLPQMMALALAAGVERVGVYKMQDAPREETADPEPFGLLRLDGSPRPGYFTFRTAARMLAGMDDARVMERDSWLRVRLAGRGKVLHVLWARFPGGALATFPAEGPRAVVYDQWGRKVTVLAPEGGRYSVGLESPLCTQDPCMIGGPVLYVVEEGGSKSTPTLLP